MYNFVLLKGDEEIPIKSNREKTFLLVRGDGFYILRESDDGRGYKFYKISKQSKKKRKEVYLLPVRKKESKFLTEIYVKKSLVLKQGANRQRFIYQVPGDKISKILRHIIPIMSVILKKIDRESLLYRFREYRVLSA